MRLKNQAALVTGAASGFGAVIARQYIPLGRLSTPACIARAALCRASDGAEFITGIGFPVVGGRTV